MFLSRGEASVWSVVVGTGVGFIISLVFNYLASVFFVFQNNTFAKTINFEEYYSSNLNFYNEIVEETNSKINVEKVLRVLVAPEVLF